MKVKFSCDERLLGVLPEPTPSLKQAPEYYKNIKPQSTNHPSTNTVKRCVPFLDALSAGYIIRTWVDMHIEVYNGTISIDNPQSYAGPPLISEHDLQQFPNHPLADRPYGDKILKFHNPWIVTTQRGVSCLFTSPLNHLETRFKILDGIVDTDNYYNHVHFPWIWTGGDGTFFIPKNTPLVQVIPFRRERSSMSVGIINMDERNKTTAKLGSIFSNGYRTFFWHNRKEE